VENINQETIEKFSEFNPQEVFTPENPTPNNPPWSSWTAFFVWFASIAFIVVIPSLFVLPYLARQGNALSGKASLTEFLQTDPTAVLISVLAIIPAHILTLVLAWAVVTRLNKYSFKKTIGWSWDGFNIWHCLLILGGIFAVAAITSNYFPEQDNELLKILRSSRTAVYVVAFIATFTAPIVEEVVYRGVLYSALQKSFGVPTGIFFVTVLFAAVHVWQYYPSFSTIFLICLISLILTWLRYRTGNLLPCIVLHTIFNGIQSLLLILQPFLEGIFGTTAKQSGAVIHYFK
jgi:membrane protease YdiL (CAAX protease family)